jgi:hypothetical protein
VDVPCVEVTIQPERSDPMSFLSSVHARVWEGLEAVDSHIVVGVVNHLKQKMHTEISIKYIYNAYRDHLNYKVYQN